MGNNRILNRIEKIIKAKQFLFLEMNLLTESGWVAVTFGSTIFVSIRYWY
jgi:hypothetical protein